MRKNIIKNIVMLYGLTVAKLVFPLLTLPYLTRVLSLREYGVVAYVTNIMVYIKIFIDYGFDLSGTKDIVGVREDRNSLNIITTEIVCARVVLSVVAFIGLLLLTYIIPILHENKLFTILSFIPAVLTIFLFDYVFRGLEKMEIITQRFVVMKAISTILTFVFVHSGQDMLWIPVLDILGSLFAVILVYLQLKKLGINIVSVKFSNIIFQIRKSTTYFISNIATTIFTALLTVMIGIYLSAADIAFWSVTTQIVAAIQVCYVPITDGVYPDMVKSKNITLIKNIIKIVMPLVTVGCIVLFSLAKFVLFIIGGAKYVQAYWLLQILIPVIFISFPAMLFGWPALGAIDKPKQVMTTTVTTGAFQIVFMVLLLATHSFDLFHIAILRCATEFVLFTGRFAYCVKYKNEFSR